MRVLIAIVAILSGSSLAAFGETRAERELRELTEDLGRTRGQIVAKVESKRYDSAKERAMDVFQNKSQTVPERLRLERAWQTGKECGPVALFFLLRCNGIDVRLEDVMASVPTADAGSSMEELRKAAESFRLKTQVIRFEPEAMADIPVPFVIHWKGSGGKAANSDHYDVVLKVGREQYIDVLNTTNCVVERYVGNRLVNTTTDGYALIVDQSGSVITNVLIVVFGLVILVDIVFGVYLAAEWLRRRSDASRRALAGP